ncbi:ubiquitin carboxyl-terminal hydrolase 5 [Tanacetum coccineum]|uniref:Ubiquitin carboxyl-terminal hydrolase 5 n=1 Tax=Tanacetum coccineum TaxID=301880 RepID=A0ABQ5I5H0_9ASTR
MSTKVNIFNANAFLNKLPTVEEPEHDAAIASNVGYSDEGLGPSVYSCSTKDGPSSEHQVSSVSSNLQRPPSIDNSDFISRSAYENSPELEIYDTLVEGTDYILVPEKMWNLFYKWMLVVVLYERLDVINASTAKNTQLRY